MYVGKFLRLDVGLLTSQVGL